MTDRKSPDDLLNCLMGTTLAEGLRSPDLVVRVQAQGTRALIEGQLIETIMAAGAAGRRIAQVELGLWARSAHPNVRAQAQRTKSIIAAALKAQPPKTPGEKIAQDLNVDLGNAGTLLGRTAYNLGRTIARNVRMRSRGES